MTNAEVAEILRTLGEILEIRGENPFKVRAYLNAARALEGLGEEVETLVREGRLGRVFGIGESLRRKITELVTTGSMAFYEDLKGTVPPGVLEMLKIPTLGPKKAKALWQNLGITDVEQLRAACLEGKVARLRGFGERTQAKILQGIEFRRRHRGEYLLNEALPLARRFLDHLEACREVLRASIAGSLRRWKEIVRDVDLVASSDHPERVMDHFVRAPGVVEVLVRGPTKTSVRTSAGLQVDLRVVSDDQFACALAYFTGSKEHNIALRTIAQRKGFKVSEYGVWRDGRPLRIRSEEELYAVLGFPYIPPELRENTGELEAKSLPRLVDRAAIRGLLHAHTTWSDGTARIEEMAERARALGFRYLGLSDHSQAAGYARGLDRTRLRRQIEEIDRLNRRWTDFRILKGIECDILQDGSLDLDADTLSLLDFVIGSVHSHFTMAEGPMTERVCRALADPRLDILGHPTGRLLLAREGYRIDLDRVLDAARRHGKAVELNANPDRLDLDGPGCRRAKERGVPVSIDPDAHSTAAIENIHYGIGTARRGWLEAGDVLNTRDAEELLGTFRARRSACPFPRRAARPAGVRTPSGQAGGIAGTSRPRGAPPRPGPPAPRKDAWPPG